jgi:hypothetical protein
MSIREDIKLILEKASVRGILALTLGIGATIGFLAGLIGRGIVSEENFINLVFMVIGYFVALTGNGNGNGGTE